MRDGIRRRIIFVQPAVQAFFKPRQLHSPRQRLESFWRGTAMKTTSSRKRFSPVGLLVVVTVALVLSLSALRLSYGDVDRKDARAARPAVVATVEGRDISARVYEMYLKN